MFHLKILLTPLLWLKKFCPPSLSLPPPPDNADRVGNISIALSLTLKKNDLEPLLRINLKRFLPKRQNLLTFHSWFGKQNSRKKRYSGYTFHTLRLVFPFHFRYDHSRPKKWGNHTRNLHIL